MNSPCMKTQFFPCWGDDWIVWLDVFPGQTLCRVSHQGAFQAFSWWNSCFRATDPTKLKTKLSSSPKRLFAWFPNCSTNFLQLGVTSCCGSSRDVLCWCTVLDRHCWGQMLLQMIQAAHFVMLDAWELLMLPLASPSPFVLPPSSCMANRPRTRQASDIQRLPQMMFLKAFLVSEWMLLLVFLLWLQTWLSCTFI